MVDLSQLVDLEGKVGVEEIARLPLLEDLLDLGLHLQVPHEVDVTLEYGVVLDVLPPADVDDPLPVGIGEVLEGEVKVLQVSREDPQPLTERSCEGLHAVGAGEGAELVDEEDLQAVRVAVSQDEDGQATREVVDQLAGGEVRNSLPSHQNHSGELGVVQQPLLQQPLEDGVLLHHEDVVGINLEFQIRNVLNN